MKDILQYCLVSHMGRSIMVLSRFTRIAIVTCLSYVLADHGTNALSEKQRIELIDSLDVSFLQHQVMERILGITDPWRCAPQYLGGARPVADLEAMVDRGDYAVAFSMQPVHVSTVLSIADANGIMPPKSTWFEPKLLSGLIVHTLS